jgi:hypothetical protein
MKTETITSLIKSPEKLKASDEKIFNEIVEKYPYFQAAQALHLKLLKQEDSFEFKKYLRLAALHTTNRRILFDFINRDLKSQESVVLKITKHEEDTKEAENKDTSDIIQVKTKVNTSNEKHSFSEWLNLTKLKPIEVKNTTDSEKDKLNKPSKELLIENFIKNNPRISKSSSSQSIPSNPVKSEPSQQMMTETLAKIYLEQKKYDRAIQAYNILILNNPKKSSFFADQIKKIESLKENN